MDTSEGTSRSPALYNSHYKESCGSARDEQDSHRPRRRSASSSRSYSTSTSRSASRSPSPKPPDKKRKANESTRGSRARSPTPDTNDVSREVLQRTSGNQNHVTSTYLDNGEEQTTVELPYDEMEAVVGERQITIRKIARMTDTEITYDQSRSALDIRGLERDVKRAKKYIFFRRARKRNEVRLQERDDDDDVTVLDIPQECAGFVSGAQGANMNEIEFESETFIYYGIDERRPKLPPGKISTIIFGERQGRRQAELRIMALVEMKLRGYYSYSERYKPHLEPPEVDWGTDIIDVTQNFKMLLGKGGNTKRKLARAARCVIEYIGTLAFISGTNEQRRRGRTYIQALIEQIEFQKVEIPDLDMRDDISAITIPTSSVGYVTGKGGAALRDVEERTKTFCFIEDSSSDKECRVFVCGADAASREEAIHEIEKLNRIKVEIDQRVSARSASRPYARRHTAGSHHYHSGHHTSSGPHGHRTHRHSKHRDHDHHSSSRRRQDDESRKRKHKHKSKRRHRHHTRSVSASSSESGSTSMSESGSESSSSSSMTSRSTSSSSRSSRSRSRSRSASKISRSASRSSSRHKKSSKKYKTKEEHSKKQSRHHHRDKKEGSKESKESVSKTKKSAPKDEKREETTLCEATPTDRDTKSMKGTTHDAVPMEKKGHEVQVDDEGDTKMKGDDRARKDKEKGSEADAASDTNKSRTRNHDKKRHRNHHKHKKHGSHHKHKKSHHRSRSHKKKSSSKKRRRPTRSESRSSSSSSSCSESMHSRSSKGSPSVSESFSSSRSASSISSSASDYSD